jgi:acetyltransferase-like isoleucine patch superfamily enzyme
MDESRTLPWDWYPGTIPGNVVIDETAFVETSFSFHRYRSEMPVGVNIGRGASAYQGTMFDVGRRGQVLIGNFALVNGALIICDATIEIGDFALIAWNVVLMDTYRFPVDPSARRHEIRAVARRRPRVGDGTGDAQPIRIGPNTWIGFDVCVLPGVTIGEGAIIGARSVVTEDVPPYTLAAGNPSRIVRRIEMGSEISEHRA